MRPRSIFKRVLSCILAVSLSILQPVTSIAASLIIEPERVEGTRFTKEQLAEGNLVYFGVTTLNIAEGNGIYEVPIYREGDLSKEASVTIHSLDISALYKEDYVLLGEDKKEYKSEKTILQLTMDGEAPGDLEEISYEFDEYGNLLGETGRREISLDDSIATPSEATREELLLTGVESEEEIVSAGDGAAAVMEETAPENENNTEPLGNADNSAPESDQGESLLEEKESLTTEEETVLSTEMNPAPMEITSAPAETNHESESASEDVISEIEEDEEPSAVMQDGQEDAVPDQGADVSETSEDEETPPAEDDQSLRQDLSSGLRKLSQRSPFPTSWSGALFAPEYSTSLATAGNYQERNSNDDNSVSLSQEPDTDDGDEEDAESFVDEKTLVVSPADTETESYISNSGTAEAEYGDELKASELLYSREDLSFADGRSRLAVLKEQETGQPTRETVSRGLSNSLTDAVLSQLVPEYIRKMPHSAEQVITFAPEEDVQYLKFRLYDDGESEGSEAFSFEITDTEGVEPYLATALSVLVTDDEDPVFSRISFDKASYDIHEGKTVIRLKREDALYSIASANLIGTDAETGEKHIYGTAAFAPYEEEKEVELYLTKETTLKLADFSAAEEGEITEAEAEPDAGMSVWIQNAFDAEPNSDARSFSIKIDGNTYKVKYSLGDVVGRIVDESYKPELEVGQYYFSTDRANGGIFKYSDRYLEGDHPNSYGTWDSKYKSWGTDYHGAYGQIGYYSGYTWHKGSLNAWSDAQNKIAVNPLYYRFVIPEWEQTETFGEAFGTVPNQVTFSVYETPSQILKTKSIFGKFDRGLPAKGAAGLYGRQKKIFFKLSAVDDYGNMTPKSYMKFYGIAAMYKRYLVSAYDPDRMDFLSGNGKVNVLPMQFRVNCGAEVIKPGSKDQRNVFSNPDEKQSNLVFTPVDSTVNNVTDKFGHITGYRLTINGSDKSKADNKKYPEDFIAYLNKMCEMGMSTDAIDYSRSAVDKEIKKITENLGTVPIDTYFTDWIEHSGKGTMHDGLSDESYYHELWFTPIVAYNDVTVTVVGPDESKNTCGAKFNNKALQVKEGTSVTFHAGDMLDFSATADDEAGYRVTGFEISADGGTHFDSIRGDYFYTLRPNKQYVVRPLVEANDNHVEVRFSSDLARKNLEIQGLIPSKDLDADPLWKGRNILDFDPKAKTLSERMRPDVGAACTVNVIVTGKPSEDGYVYRPVIKDRMTDKTYNTQGYSFILRSNAGDNVILLDIEKVKAADLKEYTLEGQAMSTLPAIRNDGLGPHSNPAAGYALYTVSGQSEYKDATTGKSITGVKEIFSVVDPKGAFELAKVKGKAGDRITILVDNGFNDSQITEYVFGDPDPSTGMLHVGKIDLHYPANVPSVKSLVYDYDLDSSRQKTDLNNNTVRCFDDNLTLNATVDFAGHQVEKLVYTVITVTGEKSTYEAKPIAEGANVYTVKINRMLDNLHNGDRITVYIVDKEKRKIKTDEGKTEESIPIVYPTVETGLITYIENEALKPKDLTLDGDVGNIDIPLIGTGHSNAQSGLLGFSRTDWADKQGYSLMVNFDMLFAGKGSPSVEAKKQGAADYLDVAKRTVAKKKEARNAKKAAAEAGARASQIRAMIEHEDEEEQQRYIDELSDLDQEKALNEQLMKDDNMEAKQQAATLNKKGSVEMHAIFCLDFEFVLDPTTQQYVMATYAVTVGGLFSENKTWYSLVGYVPCFLNLKFDAELDVVMGAVAPQGKQAMSAGDFEGYSGNVKDILTGSDVLWEVDTILKGKLQVGAGLCGVLSARGGVNAQFHLQFLDDHGAQDWWGVLLDAGGTIGFDLVLLSLNIDIAHVNKGWGSLAGATKVSFLNNQFKIHEDQSIEALPDVAGAGELYGIEGEDGISTSEYELGSSDMSEFGNGGSLGSLRGQPVPVHTQILLEDAADRTRPKLVTLSDGRQFAVFVGASVDGDASCLYYTVRDKGGDWSTPLPVSDDNTYDSTPDLAVKDNKVFIAWADAAQEVEGIEETKEQLSSFMIAGAVYDADSDTMGEEFILSRAADGGFLNLAPELSVTEDGFVCAYMTRDISKCSSVEELSDMQGNYSTMQLAKYDMASGKVENKYVTVRHETMKDPLLLDYQTETLRLHDTEYLLTAYTLDLDEDLATDDRDLYLEVHDLTNGKDYWPIRIREDDRSQAVPELTTINGSTYLTWLEDGKYFDLLNVGELLEGLFFEGSAGSVYRGRTEEDTNWYISSASELGVSESEFEESWYGSIADGDFRPFEAEIIPGDRQAAAIDKYTLAADDTDLYLFYTDYSEDVEKPTVELYGKRFRQMAANGFLKGEDPAADMSRKWDITDSVAITSLDKVIDDFALTMTDDHKISLLSDFYEQRINDEGKMEFGRNSLLGIDFQPVSSLKIEEATVKTGDYAIAGKKSHITFDIKNCGLLEAEGYAVEAVLSGSGETVYEEEFPEATLDTNETLTVYVPWTVPDNASGSEKLIIRVREMGTAAAGIDDGEGEVRLQPRLAIDPGEGIIRDGKIVVRAELVNHGAATSEAVTVNAWLYKGYEEGKFLGSTDAPALKSGEKSDLEIVIDPSVDDWDDLGTYWVKLTVESADGKTLAHSYEDIYSLQPVMLDISKGLSSIEMKTGDTETLITVGAPWNDLLTEIRYYSTDNSVAKVDADGRITAVGKGTCTIYAYCPVYGIIDSITVAVKDNGEKKRRYGGGGSEGRTHIYGLPSWVTFGGYWMRLENGVWNYDLNGTIIRDRWICLYNPYADTKKGQKQYGWFRFNEAGTMLTGWVSDPDGNLYYLNPVSDGTQGMMLTGWQQIGGKWYYFSEAEGSGTMGALLRDTVTPDGYRVNAAGVWVQEETPAS